MSNHQNRKEKKMMDSLFSEPDKQEFKEEAKNQSPADKMATQSSRLDAEIRQMSIMFSSTDKLNEGLPKLYQLRQKIIAHRYSFSRTLSGILRKRKTQKSQAINSFYASFLKDDDKKRKPTSLDRDAYLDIHLANIDSLADDLNRQIEHLNGSLATVDKMLYGVQSKIDLSR